MKVSLVNARISNRLRPPLGICYIAAMLEKHGYSVDIFDYFYDLKKQMVEFKKFLAKEKPDVVGFTATTPQIPLVVEMANIVKSFDKKITVVVGGAHPSACPFDFINDKNIDAEIIGEGEYTMLDIVKNIEKGKNLSGIQGVGYIKNGKPHIDKAREPIEDLSELPWPARHLVSRAYFTKRNSLIRGNWMKTTTLMASRGCPARCIYCSAYKVFGRKTHYREPKDVVDEIMFLVKRYGIDSIWFADDTFTVDKKWLSKVCDLLIKRKKPVKWACQARANTIDEAILRKMKKAGCIQVEFGVESGSQKVLNALKKGVKVEHTIRAFDLCRKLKIKTMANFIVGSPEETLEDIELTRRLAKRIKPDFAEFFVLTPFRGTELYDMAKKNKWLKKGDSYYGRESDTHSLNINFTDEQLNNFRNKLFDEFSKSIFKSYVFNFSFVLDLFLYSLRNPVRMFNFSMLLFKGKKISEVGRKIEQDMRIH
jgi:radical SAM superfamily enzyme YgiQ (UPF0313 family)